MATNLFQLIRELETMTQPEFFGFPTIRQKYIALDASMNSNYPPRNIIYPSDNEKVIEIAVAGFSQDELKVEYKDSLLVVSGTKEKNESYKTVFRGISQKSFKTSFVLDEYDTIESVDLKDGLLTITISIEVPESKKPKIFEIGYNTSKPQLLTENSK